MLYPLKRAGISQSDLVTVYLSVVRPVLEYACREWHTHLQQYLTDNIETIQKRTLQCIFRGASYAEILCNVGLQTLKERRGCICKEKYVLPPLLWGANFPCNWIVLSTMLRGVQCISLPS